MNEAAGLWATALTFVGLGVCVLLRVTGLLNFTGAEVLFLLASTASLAGTVVGAYWLAAGSSDRKLQGSVLAAGGCVGLAVCAGALVIRGNGRHGA